MGKPDGVLGGLGQVLFRVFHWNKREGGKGNCLFCLCAQQTHAQCAFVLSFTKLPLLPFLPLQVLCASGAAGAGA